ncbi:hypothetical protein AOLI_G00330060 [Acnodon oligacanthus]
MLPTILQGKEQTGEKVKRDEPPDLAGHPPGLAWPLLFTHSPSFPQQQVRERTEGLGAHLRSVCPRPPSLRAVLVDPERLNTYHPPNRPFVNTARLPRSAETRLANRSHLGAYPRASHPGPKAVPQPLVAKRSTPRPGKVGPVQYVTSQTVLGGGPSRRIASL